MTISSQRSDSVIGFKRLGCITVLAVCLYLNACTQLSASRKWTPLSSPNISQALDKASEQDDKTSPASQYDDLIIPDANSIQDGIDALQIQSRKIPSLNNTLPVDAQEDNFHKPLTGPKLNVTLPPQPLPSFVNAALGDVLGLSFSLGAGVAKRTDLVSLRSVRDMEPETFFQLTREALKDYGLAISYSNDLYQVVEVDQFKRTIPRFIRARARVATPEQLRPVVQFVQIEAIDSGVMDEILRQAFGRNKNLTIKANRATNSMTLSGLPADVNAALDIIVQMDELQFAGTQTISFRPKNWRVDDLADALSDVLKLEGFVIGVGTRIVLPITLLPMEYTNQLMIFAQDPSRAEYVLAAARRLDADAERGEVRSAHIYQVNHYKASDLAEIANKLYSNNANQNNNSGRRGSASNRSGDALELQGLTVDEQGNRLIFFGRSAEFSQLLDLFDQLDTPATEVLIEVTIAEVTLTDDVNYGLDFLLSQVGDGQYSLQAGTQNGIGLSGGGFSTSILSGDFTVNASALASNNQINILSVPRIITRSGVSASINVGTDVPIITSQRAASTQLGGSTDILQNVEYRKTGVILSVEPVVFSNNRIDLTVTQEVSSAEANQNQAIASPVISTRALSTQLSIQDGQTAVLGGLMENRFTRGNTGVPFIKDIPIIGSAFRTETMNATKTVLLVLITPYVMKGRQDYDALIDTLSDSINSAYQNQEGRSKTLTPPSQHFTLPTSNSTSDE